ncbi:MAG: S-methyl-5-thioribose-1-phosphate isomerase [Proteobacteria bacterium]|nr:S-methyl-5-thioribose-1-phosphate isomerase [Pseudomonadota bacterium]
MLKERRDRLGKNFYTIAYNDQGVSMIDQRLLPEQEVYHLFTNYEDVAMAIKNMVIRGAPAIGIATAFGISLAVERCNLSDREKFDEFFHHVLNVFSKTRPTAVNLFWAIDRMKGVYEQNRHLTLDDLKAMMKREALTIYKEDLETCKKIGVNGSVLIGKNFKILTHCNAGALATSDYGTALSVIRQAHLEGKNISVFADETRPYLQGARLTSWELNKDGIPVTVICDNMAGFLMAKGEIDCVIVGADRISANGDTANKIGTYSLAVLANYHKIPFYVCAPLSTIDLNIPDGSKIPIELRDAEEITHFKGHRIVCEGVSVFNPSFDVTPSKLITAIVTEKGVIYPDFTQSIQKLFSNELS